MRKLRKILSAILVVVLCVQIIAPGTAAIGATPFAEGNVAKSALEGADLPSLGDELMYTEIDASVLNDNSTPPSSERSTTLILDEIEELRTENTKHYRHKDGTYTAAIYPEPIHYMDSTGSWKDIDNTLTLNSNRKSVSGKATYTPVASSLDIRVPQDFTDNQMLTIGKDGYSVGMRIKAPDDAVTLSRSSATTLAKINSSKAIINNNFENIEAISTASITDDSASKNLKVETENRELMKLEKKVSAVNYNDILEGTDLQYVITPSKVKENIIVNEKQDSYIYQFELDLDGLVAIPQDNGSIKLYESLEDDEALFVIETPYMYDANEETSFDVVMSLNGDILTITANSEWINDENREFPVVIDPTFAENSSTFYDATANKNTPIMNFDSYKYLYAGNGLLNLRRTYFKFSLPSLPDGSVVTNAKLEIKQHDVDLADSKTKLIAFDLTGKASWSESSITWNNQPLSKDKNGPRDDTSLKKLDYEFFKVDGAKGKIYSFNLTKAVKNWYEGANNNGIMITSSNEEENSQTTLYSSDHSDGTLHPSVTINYSNNIGLEDYWTYETVDLGRSGCIYANPYNGAVTYVHSDLNMTGNRLPISISHIHNSNTDGIYTDVYSGMFVGQKYHLNIQEIVVKVNSNKYIHYDSDGTIHYYLWNSSVNKITHEYEPTKVLTDSGSGYIITDGQNNKKHFNSKGQLFKLVDKNGNEQIITIIGDQIKEIIDPAGRKVTFDYYDDSTLLKKMTDPSGRVVSFEYSGTGIYTTLSKITYSDGKFTSFWYSTGDIYSVDSYDGSYSTISYTYKSCRGRRIENIKNYDSAAQFINMLFFKFTEDNSSGVASGNTVVSNYLDTNKTNLKGTKTYLFDVYGRATSVTNENGQTQYKTFGSNSDSSEFNKLKDNSESLTIATNLLRNHGFEKDNTYWSALQTATNGSWGIITDKTKSSRGSRCLQLELFDNVGTYEVDQDFISTAGQTYTVSVDINIPEALVLTGDNGVTFGFTYCVDGVWKTDSSYRISSTNGWERFSHTFTLPTGNVSNCHVFLKLSKAKGTTYFDNVQVEKGGGSQFYNLVENSDFSHVVNSSGTPVAATAYQWSLSDGQSSDGVYYRDWGGRNFFEIAGSTEHRKYLGQLIPINAVAGDTMIIGGKVAAYASESKGNEREFRVYASMVDGNSVHYGIFSVDFDPNINQERQIQASSITLPVDCSYITLFVEYSGQTGPLSVDNLFVYIGNFGDHYVYRDDGLTDYSYNDDGSVTNYTYENNNVSQITETTKIIEEDETNSETGKTVAEYEYDSKNNITKATNNIGTVIEYSYNPAGQVTEQTTKITNDNDEVVSISESFEYYQGGNYIKKHISETGGITLYEYDNININDVDVDNKITKGLLTKVTDPNGNITTYVYDTNTDELLSTSGEAEPSFQSTTSFTYENYLPKTITRNGTTYSYNYDSQGRVLSSKVGTQTLAENSYDSQKLLQLSYANGAVYTPSYDSNERLTGTSWNGSQTSTYFYSQNERLSKFVDNVTGVSYQYDYAFFGLPFKITGSDGTKTKYDYDLSGNLARLTFSDDGVNIYSGKYFTNEKGMPEDVIIDTLDGKVIHYNYDDFGRIVDYSYGPIVRSYEYKNTNSGDGIVTNSQVSRIIDETLDGNPLQIYDFEYNPDGSFYLSVENVEQEFFDYIYDDLGRVIENYTNGDLFEYSYDAGGNLTSVVYNLEPLHTYTYGNANWKDQLTAFDGKTITYDANGNPLTYDGYNYSWQRGTYLSSIVGNGKNISYVYDSQGNRVQKTVNGVTTNYLYSCGLLMRQTDGTNTLDFQYDANGDMIGFVYNGTPYYYLRNIMNDVVGIVDENGNVVAKYRYDAFGNIIHSSGILATINPIKYRGYYFDAETGWYYLKSRYYNPEWSRFISPDSVFVAGDAIAGSNMYAYCNNDPVTYIDENGTAAVENDFEKITRFVIDTATFAGWFIPEDIGNWMITGVLGNGTNDFSYFSNSGSALSNFIFDGLMRPFTMDFLYYADYIISPIVGLTTGKWDWKDRVYETDRGLQNIIWPYTMAMGARLGAFFLEFFPDSDGYFTNYTTREGQYQWQHKMGYNWLYDAFFSLGGPIKKLVYEFTHTNPDNETKYYAVWCWKGDYWNLGPGAEIGVYVQEDEQRAKRGFYDIDKDNLKVKTHMKVDYNGKVGEIQQTNWWITMFMPWKGQRISLDDLQVWQAVSFDIPVGKTDANGTPYIVDYSKHDNLNLFDSFKDSDWDDAISSNKELNLRWGPTPPTDAGWDYLNLDGSYYGNFQFYIKF